MVRAKQTPWRRTLRREDRRFKNSRSTLFVNGWMLILGSFLLLVIGVGRDMQEHATILGVLGSCTVFAVLLLPGILMVRASKRMRRPTWLENLRFRESGDANNDQPQGPTKPDQPGG